MGKSREEILTEGIKKLLDTGPASFSVDRFCRELNISKRTFYKLFPTKKDFIRQAIIKYVGEISKHIIQIDEQDALREHLRMAEEAARFIQNVRYEAFRQLIEYYPDLWRTCMDMVSVALVPVLEKHLEKGKREGIYRKDINTRLFALLRIALMELVHSPILLKELGYNVGELQKLLTEFYLQSILSEKGREALSKAQHKNK